MKAPMPTADDLKARFKSRFDAYPESSKVRLHRAISWLRCAERQVDEVDARFIFLWIAFNAAYARELGFEQNERDRLADFFGSLLAVDAEKRLHGLMFTQFTGPIRTLIENKFVFEPFWRALREHDSSNRWEGKFVASKKTAMTAVVGGQTLTVLGVVFDRLYVLRNQLIHGGATWHSEVNRAQLHDGAQILLSVVPLVLGLMIDHPELDFGDVLYPVVK